MAEPDPGTHMIFKLPTPLVGMALLALAGVSGAQTLPATQAPFIIAPSVEGLMVCDEAAQNPALRTLEQVLADCQARKAHGAAALKRLLDTLEPGGPKNVFKVSRDHEKLGR